MALPLQKEQFGSDVQEKKKREVCPFDVFDNCGKNNTRRCRRHRSLWKMKGRLGETLETARDAEARGDAKQETGMQETFWVGGRSKGERSSQQRSKKEAS